MVGGGPGLWGGLGGLRATCCTAIYMVAPGWGGGRQGGVIVLGRLSLAFSPQGNNWKGGRCDTCFPVGLELGEASVVPATAPAISVSRFKLLASVNRLIRWQLLRSLKADKIAGIRPAIRSALPLLPSLNYLELSFSCSSPGNRVLSGGISGWKSARAG